MPSASRTVQTQPMQHIITCLFAILLLCYSPKHVTHSPSFC